MGRVSFDFGKTFIAACDLTKEDLAKIRALKRWLSEDVAAELHRCQSAAKAWCGPLKHGVDDIILRKCIELSRYDLVFFAMSRM